MQRHTNNTTFVDVLDIRFSQRTVSNTFQDGRTLEELTNDLVTGKQSVNDVPYIRLVKFRNQWVTMDNRRLRVFTDAFIQKIPVIICDLKDEAIAKEFHQKRSNKSLTGGGIITEPPKEALFTDSLFTSTQHFEEGAYVFTKKVLNWTLEQLKESLALLKHTDVLPDSFYSASSYYSHFKNLILEETRASIQNGIEAINPKDKISVKLIKEKIANNPENPSIFTFIKLEETDSFLKSGTAVLIEHCENAAIQFLCISTYLKSELDNQIQLKLVIDDYMLEEFSEELETKSEWVLYDLCPVITYQRMYEICCLQPDVPFVRQLISGDVTQSTVIMSQFLQILNLNVPPSLDEPTALRANNLNPSQQEAINKFLHGEELMQFVQGPPGTGKTTMIIHLLAELADRKKRTLVCAPSNKAVQEIAIRFMKQFPHITISYSGVEEKLPESSELFAVFIHTWGQQQLQIIADLKQGLWKFIPEKNTKAYRKSLIIGLKTNFQSLAKNYHDTIKKYNLDFNADYEKIIVGLKEIYDVLIDNFANESIQLASAVNQQHVKSYLFQYAQRLDALSTFIIKAMVDDSSSGLEVQLIDGSQIVFATLSVAGRKTFKLSQSFDMLVVDEASQCVEAESIIPFANNPKRCLFIGDTNQLTATVMSQKAKDYNFHRPLMHRFIEDRNQPFILLNVQYRMAPPISAFPIQQFYQDKVSNHPSVNDLIRVPQKLHSMIEEIGPYNFIDVNGNEQSFGKSFFNRSEAELIKQYLDYLSLEKNIDVVNHVGVITFYSAQAKFLQNHLSYYKDLKVQTVDSFQGCENDIIIISFVRANQKAQVGFLKDFRRLNVAITRAKFSLLMVGNATSLGNSTGDLADLISHVKEEGALIEQDEFSKRIRISKKMMMPNYPPKKRSTQACRFFNGEPQSCRFGSRCKFEHATPNKFH